MAQRTLGCASRPGLPLHPVQIELASCCRTLKYIFESVTNGTWGGGPIQRNTFKDIRHPRNSRFTGHRREKTCGIIASCGAHPQGPRSFKELQLETQGTQIFPFKNPPPSSHLQGRHGEAPHDWGEASASASRERLWPEQPGWWGAWGSCKEPLPITGLPRNLGRMSSH